MKFSKIRLLALLGMMLTATVTHAVEADKTPVSTEAPAPSTQSDPVEMIRALSNSVLAEVRNDSAIQKGDNTKIQALVAQKIVPHVDFEHMTQLAAGRFWRDATPEQRTQLTEQFRQLLIYTYSGALTQIKDQKIEFKKMRIDPSDTDLIVRSRVIQGNGQEPISFDYRVEKTPEGWKIYDVNVLGAWLIQAYKDTFTSEIQKGGINGLIKVLEQKNASLAEKASKPAKPAKKS